jgi:transcriptional regulator with XRE-family HTH domain|tara:strand:+ start:61 stop:288 length:228 start_codon:yes stop_codon:yes gene_type:complete
MAIHIVVDLEQVKDLMVARGLNQAALAREANLNYQRVWRFFHGVQSLNTSMAIARALQCSIGDFVTRTQDPEVEN